MTSSIASYSTLVFDCDGVVLNSNRVKTDGFRTAALPWGAASANELVEYHLANGGISRYEKFSYFLESILPRHVPSAIPGSNGPSLEELISNYAQAVHDGLLTCSIAEGLESLRERSSNANWFIVSGGDQNELRKIFSLRRLEHLFDGGIFGSPESKDLILSREIASGSIRLPALFIGDSRYDHVASRNAGMDFLFASRWTDLKDWQAYVSSHGIDHIDALSDLL